MTAANSDQIHPQYGTPDDVTPKLVNLPVAATTTIYAGTMVASDASGNAVPASSNAALKLWGRAEIQVVNNPGAAGDKRINVRCGVFAMANSGAGADQILAANVGQIVYAVDDNVVALTDGNGTRPVAGLVYPFDPNASTKVQVGIGPGFGFNANTAQGGAFRARNVVTANVASLAAYTVASNGDGVTPVAGDVVILAAQTTAAQNGPYVVGTVTTGVAPLTRPTWFAAGSTQDSGVAIVVGGEGTVFKNTTWRAMVAADSFVVDTTDGKFYPVRVSGQTALTAGTFTISTVPVFSVKSGVTLTRSVANTTTATVNGYAATVGGANGITAGVIGVAAIIVEACIANGTKNAADVSTINWTIDNQA